MKTSIIVLSVLLAGMASAYASKYYTPETPNYVHGYTKSDGTTVQPYYRANRGEAQDNDSSSANDDGYGNDNDSGYGNNSYGSNEYGSNDSDSGY